MITTIKTAGLAASINHKGAELISLRNAENTEFMWDGNPQFWGKHSPILFPIVGTLRNNSHSLDGNVYHLPRHGFARDMDFLLIEKTIDCAVFSLKHSDETLQNYPFNFELQITYKLIDDEIHIKYHLLNTGSDEMPFSIGAHPAFALQGNFKDYTLQFEGNEKIQYHLLENDLISDKTNSLTLKNNQLALEYSLFANDAMIFKDVPFKSITILGRSKPLLKIAFADFPHLGIWTKEKAPFLCIEPWFGYSDTTDTTGNLFEKEAIQLLKATETFEAKFTIKIF